ncbi:nitrate- and nitrite sensing domain-containing protein [Nocardia sp. NPDC057663]|uniref:sensor histidine kinase n=1 Tax=Nocardia sp. NPDC057663 TaxID=3346201 RepID=UPI00366AE630
MFKAKIGIRGRILSIALVPSFALLATGSVIAGVLVDQGTDNKDWAARVDRDSAPGITFAIQIQQERRLTLLAITGDAASRRDLAQQRVRVDGAIAEILAAGASFTDIDPELLTEDVAKGRVLAAQLPTIRQRADFGTLPLAEAYDYYNSILSVYTGSTELISRDSPTPDTSIELAVATRLLRVAESMSRSNALAMASLREADLSTDAHRQFAYDIGTYRTELAAIAPHLPKGERSTLENLTTSAAWLRLRTQEDAIVDHHDAEPTTHTTGGFRTPLDNSEWQDVATQVTVALLDLWREHYRYALHSATKDGDRALDHALLNGGGVLLVAAGAYLVAAQLSRRLIRRLRRLREETLELADEHLPRITTQLREGLPVHAEDAVQLDFGDDEIGQVAHAFNRAQAAAVAAAVAEAKTRAGVNAVFVNISYRSQGIIHRQLALLDKAERTQEDPTQLELLFRLDHLATRARRNAENLIILGGGQPGRRWRNAVSLSDIVRSAIAETEHYQRVDLARVPDVSIVGRAVADTIHLLAELVDNATAFSPPESKVEVTAQVVGKGIAIDVTDQGLGMSEADLQLANENFRNPPDFTVTTLSDNSRLGLFVVSQLASRHNATVRLTESAYGGVRAIVVLPTALISDDADDALVSIAEQPSINYRSSAPIQLSENQMHLAQSNPMPSVSTSWDAPSASMRTETTIDSHHSDFARIDASHVASITPDGRPALPRRHRQASIAPELTNEPTETPTTDQKSGGRHRGSEWTADQARNVMSAIEAGTRQGRQPISKPATNPDDPYEDEGLT